jgi:biopolymer transport protein ExbD
MKYRAAKRFWARSSELDRGLPWSSPLGIAVTYMVVRQLVMLLFYFFLGGREWVEFWSSEVFLGLSLRGWFHVTNAAVIVFVVTDFWRFMTNRGSKSRAMLLVYAFALLVLSGMQYAIWPARCPESDWWYVPEGDFQIKMRYAALFAGAPETDPPPPMTLVLRADGNGDVASMRLDEKSFLPGDWEAVRVHVIGILGDDRGPNSNQATAEVELDCDYNLRYEHVIDAITAVSGYRDENGKVVRLIETISFSPPKKAVAAGPVGTGSDRPVRPPDSELVDPSEFPFAQPICLQLTKSGDVIMQGDLFLMRQIPRRLTREIQILQALGKTVDDVTIIIRADKDCRIGEIQELIRICQDQGFESFALRARLRQKR